jgi:hypothetical protein
MALNPRIWYPIAALGSFLNVIAVAFAVQPASPWHATIHAALAVGFGVWAQQLRARQRPGVLEGATATELSALRDEVEDLRHQLGELEERMDFAERVLSQARDVQGLPNRKPDE